MPMFVINMKYTQKEFMDFK